MDIGLVLQTDPPASAVVDLMVRAEELGFSHGWTFDSHVLWQEPYVIYPRILERTSRMIVGPMVTNPGTRDWTVIASLHATLNDMFGNRTICGIGRGDSAMRVQGRPPTTLARLEESIHVIRELAEGRAVDLDGTTGCRSPGCRTARRCRCGWPGTGPKALDLVGRAADGFILQLADPYLVEWTVKTVRGRGRGGRPGPGRRSPSAWPPRRTSATTSRTPATSAAGSAGWSATTSPTSSPATASRRPRCPPS